VSWMWARKPALLAAQGFGSITSSSIAAVVHCSSAGHQREAWPLWPGAAGPADPVHIIFGDVGQAQIHHVGPHGGGCHCRGRRGRPGRVATSHAQSSPLKPARGAGAGPLASCCRGWPWPLMPFLTETVGEPVGSVFVREKPPAPAASCCCGPGGPDQIAFAGPCPGDASPASTSRAAPVFQGWPAVARAGEQPVGPNLRIEGLRWQEQQVLAFGRAGSARIFWMSRMKPMSSMRSASHRAPGSRRSKRIAVLLVQIP